MNNKTLIFSILFFLFTGCSPKCSVRKLFLVHIFFLTLLLPQISFSQNKPFVLNDVNCNSLKRLSVGLPAHCWAGQGFEARWEPVVNYNFYVNLEILLVKEGEHNLGTLKIMAVDQTLITDDEYQWLQLVEKFNFSEQLKSPSSQSLSHGRFWNTLVQPLTGLISLDAEDVLLQSKRIPIYVYGIKGTEGTEIDRYNESDFQFKYEEYEEYLVATFFLQVPYTLEAQQFFQERLQLQDEYLNEAKQKMVIQLSFGFGVLFISAGLLWAFRNQVIAFFTWTRQFAILIITSSFVREKFYKEKSPELKKLEKLSKEAVQRGDFEEATRLIDLANKYKKVN